MGFFEDTITKAKEIVGETGKIAEDVISLQKLKLKLSSKKSEQHHNYELLGQYVYNEKIEGEDNSEAINALVEVIKDTKAQIETLETEIATAKGSKICSCGAANKDTAQFCNSCGKEL